MVSLRVFLYSSEIIEASVIILFSDHCWFYFCSVSINFYEQYQNDRDCCHTLIGFLTIHCNNIRMVGFPYSRPFVDDAQLALWSRDHHQPPPEGVEAGRQKAWDCVRTCLIAEGLLQNARDGADRVWLLAVSTKESGAWLEALPISSMGLRMDDNALRVSVGLRLGIPIFGPHVCGNAVDSLGRHGLSCKKSGDRHYRHSALNDIIKRALISVHVPCRLEPQGLFQSDGKRPDGASLVPWKSGQSIAWDATCRDSFAPFYRSSSTHSPGAVADLAEVSKCQKYQHLPPTHCFTPVAFESLGAVGSRTLKDIGRRIRLETGEPKATFYLLQSSLN